MSGLPARAEITCSIVIINHNYGRFLDQAVRSALAQLSGRVQVVVVDDASTDDSRERIAALPGHVVRVLLDQSGGHVRALNAGFAASDGELVVFLDADDWLEPDCLDTVMTVWQPDLSKVQFRLNTVDRDGADQGMPFPFFSAALNPAEILRRSLATGYYPWSVSSGNAYARRYLAQVLPIPADVIFKSPDGYLNKLAPLFGQVVTLDTALANYRVHGSNAWAQTQDNVNLKSLTRAVRFDALLHGVFVERAAQSGYVVPPYAELAVPQWVEYRMLSLRLAPAEHPIAGDGRVALTALGSRALSSHPTSAGRDAYYGLAGSSCWAVHLPVWLPDCFCGGGDRRPAPNGCNPSSNSPKVADAWLGQNDTGRNLARWRGNGKPSLVCRAAALCLM